MTIRHIKTGKIIKCSDEHAKYMIANNYAKAVIEKPAKKKADPEEEAVIKDGTERQDSK